MNNNKKAEIFLSGETRFDIDVPYKLLQTGTKDNHKPLILYLHGYNENIQIFSKKFSSVTNRVVGHHLFIRGPYPVYNRHRNKPVEDWGAA